MEVSGRLQEQKERKTSTECSLSYEENKIILPKSRIEITRDSEAYEVQAEEKSLDLISAYCMNI